MKKILVALILGVLLPQVAGAQTYDTIQWGYDKYHYSIWYDTLPEFFDSVPNYNPSRPLLNVLEYDDRDGVNNTLALPQHVERPTLVYGVAVTEKMDSRSWLITRNPWHIAEYVYLFQKVGDTLELRDSAR